MMHWERPGGGTCTTHKGRMVVLASCAVSKKEVMTERRERERERERNVVSELILLNENTGKLLMELGKW